MMAEPITPPAVDGNAALRFLLLLGLDPATVWLRSIVPNRGANRRRWDPSRKGWAPDQHGLVLAELIADCADGASVYFITGTALTATGINREGQLTGCVHDEDIISCRAFFAEWDKISIADQLIAWRTLGLPEPTVMVLTGGKSVHVYWALDQAIDPATWHAITARLIAYCKSDPQCSNPSRLMRLPGGIYHDKKSGQPTGQATIIHETGNRYSLAEFDAALTAGEQSQALELELAQHAPATGTPLAPIALRLQEFPPRPLEQIRDALSYIPRRVGGGDETYGDYRNILWGLIQACAEAGHGPKVAIGLMEAHSPSKACNWDITQVARSGGQRIAAETFWWHARQHGWRPPGSGSSRGSGPGQPKPSQPTPPQPQGAAATPNASSDQPEELPRDEQIQRLLDHLLDLHLDPSDPWAKQQATRADLWNLGVRGDAIDDRMMYALAARWGLPLQVGHSGARRGRSIADPLDSPAEDLLPGFLLWRRDHVLFGAGGTGKTMAAAAMGVSIIKGRPFLDQQITPDRSGRILWIGSDGGEGARAMVREYLEDLGVATDPEVIAGFTIWTAEGSEDTPAWSCSPRGLLELRDELEQGDYALVVIDSLKAVLELAGVNFGIGPVGTLMRFMQALVGRHCSLLWLHHPAGGKAAGKGLQAAAGSQNINQIPSAVHQLTRVVTDRGPGNEWSVHKLRGSPSREFCYRLSEDGFEVTRGEVTGNARGAILDCIEVRTERKISTATNLIITELNSHNESTIRNNLTWLRKRGLVSKAGTAWKLTPAGSRALNLISQGNPNPWR
jgi:hypothetical protein